MASIDPIYISTTFIERMSGTKFAGSATGFFFIKDDQIYLITNKHVIYGEKFAEKDTKPEVDAFKLLLHTDRNNTTSNAVYDLALFQDSKQVWFEHPNAEVDVVAIPLNIDRQRYVIATAEESMLDGANIVINFEKLFVMGYPYGWFDRTNNLPITRIGHLSTPFGVPFSGKPIMLGDVETHRGMSGGPVFMELHDYIVMGENNSRTKKLGATKRLLVGIHSGQPLWQLIDNDTKEIKEDIKHSLINIWFGSLIPEIINHNKKSP